jgi:ribosomal protein S18 acetylase RimI-like enzyme
MLTESPWAFAASPDDDFALDQARLEVLLAEEENAILAVEATEWLGISAGAPHDELLAAAGVVRMKQAKFTHRARLWGVFVEPAHRGKGLGKAVVGAAIELARCWSGVRYVDLGVSENAPAAQRLYETLGFKQWGREPEATQLEGRCYDELHMTLKL